ncbi:hypothetical protein BG004_005139 [Podila humilis]|nr:hypothetical protein BG004_005139 [Podila humilis]
MNLDKIIYENPVQWCIGKIDNGERVTFPEFVRHYGYWSEHDAHVAYAEMISSHQIPQTVRVALDSQYEIWRRNSRTDFWAGRTLSGQISITTKRTATDVVAETEHVSKKYIQDHHTDMGFGVSSSSGRFPEESVSEDEEDGGARSPSERHLARKVGRSTIDSCSKSSCFAALGQEVGWVVEGTDLVKEFEKFQTAHLEPYSLALDGVADLMQDSEFSRSLDKNVMTTARRTDPPPNIYERWPTLLPVLDRVFRSNSYDDVAKAVRSEDMQDPIAAYLFSVVFAYHHYFTFRNEIPEDLNEREGFAGLTWTFLQTPLTMYDIESRYLEIFITGSDERKNQGKNLLLESKERAQYADAVALHDRQQLLLVEAAQLHNPETLKRRQDEFKLARALRDTWISQVRLISNVSVPHRGLAVFGCSSFKDEVKLLRLNYHGFFCLQQFDLITIPLQKQDFGVKMRSSVISSLQLVARIDEEITRRNQMQGTSSLDYYSRASLRDAVSMIEKTTTPTKVKKYK